MKETKMILNIMPIPLTQGLFALVDGEDYVWLSKYKWYAIKQKNGDYYARRNTGKSSKRRTVYMHRDIMNTPQGEYTDHRSHYGLDNRKYNLRFCTHRQNHQNQQVGYGGTSKYKGVSWNKQIKKWQVQIMHDNQRIYLGLFDNELDAGLTYDAKAIELFGEFANTNF